MTLFFYRLFFICAFSTLMLPSTASAQASLAAENIIDDVTVGENESYTLFRDALEEDQWYYVPNQPRLVIKRDDGTNVPEFSLIRYQFKDPDDNAKFIEEGIMQFSATLSAPPNAIEEFRSAIQKRVGDADVRISAIPFKEANVALYDYGESSSGGNARLLSSAPFGTGVAPLFASQKMVFSVPLTKVGSDVLDEIVTGQTGVPITVDFTFNALTPPAGFKIKVDFSQIFEHYSKDEQFRASASYFGLFGASYQKSVTEIRETLEDMKAIEIEIIQGEDFDMADIDKYMQPILARINAELLEAARPPAAINPASATAPSAGGRWGSVGYSVAIKDVKKEELKTEEWDFRVRSIVPRKTVAGGFVGIGAYDKETQDRLVTVVPGSEFKSAYMILPLPSLLDEMGVESVSMDVGLQVDGETMQSQSVLWEAEGGAWKDISGNDANVLAFGLTGIVSDAKNLPTDVKFASKINVRTERQLVEASFENDVFDGQQTLPAQIGLNSSAFDVVTFDGSFLPFARVEQDGNILQGNFTVRLGGETFTFTMKPRNVDGTWIAPEPVTLLVSRPNKVVAVPSVFVESAVFQTRFGNKSWKYVGQDLSSDKSFGGLSYFVLENDLQ